MLGFRASLRLQDRRLFGLSLKDLLLAAVLILVTWSIAGSQALATPERPLVVVPGILGSKLCDGSGRVVWGDRGRPSLRNFLLLELNGSPESEAVKPCGLIDWVQILGPLWTIRAYGGLLQNLQTFGYGDQGPQKLLTFAYDWRRSTIFAAENLKKFVDENIPAGQQFDIVAHSMGGVVTRIYLTKFGGAQRVRNVIYFGTPFLGSMSTFGTLSEGWGVLENHLAGGIETIRRVALSFPAMIELLPRYARCCRVESTPGQWSNVDVLDADVWQRYGWLPENLRGGAAYDKFVLQLAVAASLDELLRQPSPAGVKEFFFAGQAVKTLFQLQIGPGRTAPGTWRIVKDLGDGTVPLWSAARDSVDESLVSFSEHATIFDDEWAVTQLRRILTVVAPEERFLVSGTAPVVSVPLADRSGSLPLESVELIVPRVTVSTGDSIQAELIAHFDKDATVDRGRYKPSADLVGAESQTSMSVRETTTDSDISADRLRFELTGDAGAIEETLEIRANLTSSKSIIRGISVLAR